MNLHKDFVTKNTLGRLTGKFITYGQFQDKVKVASLKGLLFLLAPSVDRLFQRVLAGCRSDMGPCFARIALGHNMLEDMMPRLSRKANFK